MTKSKRSPEGKEAFLRVRVKPRASRSRILGWTEDGYLEIQLKALPERGKANQACLRELSDALGLPRERIILEKGMTSRLKGIRVLGLSDEEVRNALSDQTGK